jgi:hypothetical protein
MKIFNPHPEVNPDLAGDLPLLESLIPQGYSNIMII